MQRSAGSDRGGDDASIATADTWDTFTILNVLKSLAVEDSVRDAVGKVAVIEHDDAVPLHCLGQVLLQGRVPPVIAVRAVSLLVQVRHPPPCRACRRPCLALL